MRQDLPEYVACHLEAIIMHKFLSSSFVLTSRSSLCRGHSTSFLCVGMRPLKYLTVLTWKYWRFYAGIQWVSDENSHLWRCGFRRRARATSIPALCSATGEIFSATSPWVRAWRLRRRWTWRSDASGMRSLSTYGWFRLRWRGGGRVLYASQ